jgi:hypothetical protein
VTRGYLWGYYHSDDGNTYAWRVNAEYAAMPERGWVTPAAHGTPVYPRFWSPRRVVGHDATGQRQVAIVASVTADLWTGVATTFTINGTDELPHVCHVDFSQAEHARMRP